MLIIVT